MDYKNKLRLTLLKKEEDYLKTLYGNDLQLLHKNAFNVLHLINSKNQENINDVEKIKLIRSLSINKGGFINFQNRKEIYKYILEYISRNTTCETNEKIKNKHEILNTQGRFFNEISQDFNRSNLLNTILENYDLEEEELELFKTDLHRFSCDLFDIHKKEYEYYQGFQEICLFSFILNYLSFQEENTFDYLINLSHCHFQNFLHIQQKIKFECILSILSELLEEINPNINKNLLELTNSPPYYALSWIITWFSHKNNNIFLQFRIIDYLICSPPVAIMYLVSIVS
jgi:TBC1 domain family member 20